MKKILETFDPHTMTYEIKCFNKESGINGDIVISNKINNTEMIIPIQIFENLINYNLIDLNESFDNENQYDDSYEAYDIWIDDINIVHLEYVVNVQNEFILSHIIHFEKNDFYSLFKDFLKAYTYCQKNPQKAMRKYLLIEGEELEGFFSDNHCFSSIADELISLSQEEEAWISQNDIYFFDELSSPRNKAFFRKLLKNHNITITPI